MSDLNIKPILEWFHQAKPNPSVEDACVQIGCHYEEIDEMMEALADDGCFVTDLAKEHKDKIHYAVDYLQNPSSKTSIELLDSLCDQIVTAVGVAYMLGFDIEKALSEVNRSNWSKFVDGKPQFNEQGKIAKPESYSPPDLTNFISNK
tara:strand:+ start:24615 stop:25058 length:444 start_codon:yes stop_codon:yes gene_type:complete